MAKPISTKKVIMLMLSLVATAVIFFAMSLSASAASYPAVKIDVPRISQRPGVGDCAIASMATVEAYCHELPSGDYNSKAYQAVYSANGYSIEASWSKLGYKAIDGFNMTTAYNQLKTGYPIIVHRTSQHYSVIYGYDGSSSKLELSGFLVVDVDDSYNTRSPYFRLDDWVRGSLDRMVIRQNGLAIATNELKITTNHPAKETTKGESFTPDGVVVSDSNITSISVSVNNATGAQKQNYSATPNAKSFNLSNASSKINTSSLATGSYTYWITAKDASGDTDSFKFSFSVTSQSNVTPSVEIKEVSYTAVVKADPSLNMRKGAGTEYDVITTIPNGSKISVTGECDNWARVSYNGKVGWVSIAYIEKVKESTVPDTFESYYARLKFNGALKKDDFVFSTTLINVPKNTIVKVLDESDGWVKFAYNGKVGWLRKIYCVVNIGDIDSDGKVNSSDALLVLKASTGSLTLTSNQKNAADFNGDGNANSLDALVILRVSSGATKFD